MVRAFFWSKLKFSITILGSGSATPTLQRMHTSQVVNLYEQLYLIDCGEGAQLQMRKYKVKFQKINHIFISHLHGDHYFGLIGLVSTLHLLGRTRDLYIYSPAGLKDIIMAQLDGMGRNLKYPIHFIEIDPKKAEVIHESASLEVETIPLKHKIPCCGFLFRELPRQRKLLPEMMQKHAVSMAYANKVKAGEDITKEDGTVIKNEELTDNPPPVRTYAYCSDTCYHEPILDQIKNVNLLYHESTFLKELEDRAKITFHSTAEQAAQMAKLANARHLLLGHFSARYPRLDGFESEAKAHFENVTIAVDGLTVDVE